MVLDSSGSLFETRWPTFEDDLHWEANQSGFIIGLVLDLSNKEFPTVLACFRSFPKIDDLYGPEEFFLSSKFCPG